MLGLSFKDGINKAMKVNARVKSNGQLSGMTEPIKIPTAVLICQQLHKANPAPNKYQWRNLLCPSSRKCKIDTAYASSVKRYARIIFHKEDKFWIYGAMEAEYRTCRKFTIPTVRIIMEKRTWGQAPGYSRRRGRAVRHLRHTVRLQCYNERPDNHLEGTSP